jgi:hypothetical protein
MRRCDQISHRYNARVYVQISRRHKFYDYKSTNEDSFPMPVDVLVRGLHCLIPASVRPKSWLTWSRISFIRSPSGGQPLTSARWTLSRYTAEVQRIPKPRIEVAMIEENVINQHPGRGGSTAGIRSAALRAAAALRGRVLQSYQRHDK